MAMKMSFLRFVSSLKRPLKTKLTARRPPSILVLLLYFPHDVLAVMMGFDESFGIISRTADKRKKEKNVKIAVVTNKLTRYRKI